MICLKKANPEDFEKEWLFVREMPEDERVDSLLGIVIECHVRRQFFYESCCPPLLRKWAFILRNEINDAR